MKVYITAHYQKTEDIADCLENISKIVDTWKDHYPQLLEMLGDGIELHIQPTDKSDTLGSECDIDRLVSQISKRLQSRSALHSQSKTTTNTSKESIGKIVETEILSGIDHAFHKIMAEKSNVGYRPCKFFAEDLKKTLPDYIDKQCDLIGRKSEHIAFLKKVQAENPEVNVKIPDETD